LKDTVNIGIIGLGGRGTGLLEMILKMEDVTVLGVCDLYADRANNGAMLVQNAKGNTPICSRAYQEILACPEIDAVVIASAWESHIPIAMDAMKAHKYVGMEVGGAYSVQACFDLVKTSEETHMPCMLLENCCYGRTELMVLNLVKQGLLGEIAHCSGGYHHDLRNEVAFGEQNRHYRLRNYQNRNCENYPTHELGPIAKVLHLNCGNRMLSLSSFASKAVGMTQYIKNNRISDLTDMNFEQGDVVTTVIKCAKGQTIVLTLDTTLPRAYSRGFCVRGTKGMYEEQTDSVFLDGIHDKFDFNWREQWGNAKEYYEKYDHPIWQEFLKAGIEAGHGGIDWIVFRAFFESVKSETQTPIDVYDAAAWMSISCLSEQSLSMGGIPVAIPDFTNGAWLYHNDKGTGNYSLD